jgi:hypothetical protein
MIYIQASSPSPFFPHLKWGRNSIADRHTALDPPFEEALLELPWEITTILGLFCSFLLFLYAEEGYVCNAF